jgi:hypothetical protein
MQNPPDGFAPVAQALLKAAGVAKQIRDAMQTADGRTWAAYLDFFPELNSVATAGREAIRDVTKDRGLDDPFAFVDQSTKGKDAEIDTTPTLPKPPSALIESAARGIPSILANVQPKHDGAIELVASQLAKRLQDAKHTLAAAQWAIHEAIQSGRLRTGLIEMEVPSVGVSGPAGIVWHGGDRGTIPTPKGKPAPFDAFKVVATESLWAWWRSWDAANDESPADAGQFVEQLLASPDDVELSPRDMALLEAHLRQPVSFATIQQEKKATGHFPTEAARNKLKLIRDFNRGLQGHSNADEPEKQSDPASAIVKVEATPIAPGSNASLALMRVFTNGIADDRIEKATRLLADDKLTVNEKLTKIDALIPFPATASAEQLGEMLGVTKQAVLKTDWWMQNRKGEKENEVGRRREGYRKRAKSYEATGQDDEHD